MGQSTSGYRARSLNGVTSIWSVTSVFRCVLLYACTGVHATPFVDEFGGIYPRKKAPAIKAGAYRSSCATKALGSGDGASGLLVATQLLADTAGLSQEPLTDPHEGESKQVLPLPLAGVEDSRVMLSEANTPYHIIWACFH